MQPISNETAIPLTDIDEFVSRLFPACGPAQGRKGFEEAVEEALGGRFPPEEEARLKTILREVRGNRGISIEELGIAAGTGYGAAASAVGTLESMGLLQTDLLQRCSLTMLLPG